MDTNSLKRKTYKIQHLSTMNNYQIILAIVIVGLSIIMPIYYSHKRKTEKRKLEQELKEGREVSEREKIRVYVDSINDKFRNKHK